LKRGEPDVVVCACRDGQDSSVVCFGDRSMFPIEVETLARLLVDEARQKSLRIVTAESCTGGLVAGAICAVAGASDVFERGFVTYSNRAKQELLGVPGDLIADLGAVSEPVARMMAEGALENSNAHIAVAITGVAGPGGGTRMKPVGLVHIATARSNQPLRHREEFFDEPTREGVQLAAVQAALQALRDRVE
jgi:nicotinamide-nucleotide amidase